jgi:hypothetical protein
MNRIGLPKIPALGGDSGVSYSVLKCFTPFAMTSQGL